MLSGKNWCKDASVGGLKGLNRRRPQLMELFFSLSLSGRSIPAESAGIEGECASTMVIHKEIGQTRGGG